MENKYLMIGAIVCFFCFLLYKEVKRPNKNRLFFRIVAIAGVLSALLFLILPLRYKVQKNTGKAELLLLTKGANLKVKSEQYFTTDSAVLRVYGKKQASFLPDLAYYLQSHRDITHLKIYGYGLPLADLDHLKNYQIDFYPVSPPIGITAISWPGHIKEGDLLTLQGVYHHSSASPVKLLLKGLGTTLDSVVIKTAGKVPFDLHALPKQLGRAIYTITVVAGMDTLQKEDLPFQVTATEKTKVLVLSSFPDFEYKFLKNWLYEHQYQVVFRTRVSKDKFSEDQLNTQAVNSSTLNSSLLQQFDLVIADDEELSKLDVAATASLQRAIGNGLGLLIRLNDAKGLSTFSRSVKTYAATDSAAHSFRPVLSEGGLLLKPLLVTQPFYLQDDRNAATLIKNQSGKTLSTIQLYGNGKISTSAINSTYNWLLMGEKNDYARFWSYLISKTVRKQELSNSFTTVPGLPIAGQELAVHFETDDTDSIPPFSINHTKVSLLQHRVFPFGWQAAYWGQRPGWNEVLMPSGAKDYFYVYDKDAWAALRAEHTLTQNLAYPKKISSVQTSSAPTEETADKEISKWWFVLLFLLGAGYLWFETKLL